MKKFNLVVSILFVFSSCLIAQWESAGGPNTGYLDELVTIDSTIFVSAGNGGIYKSNDKGENWLLASSGLPINKSVYVLTENNGTLYASISYSGIYKSEDKGDNWAPINNGISNITFYSIGVDSANIYASTSNGTIYYSSDGGENWSIESGIDASSYFLDITFFKSSVFIGGRELYMLSDSTGIWTEVEVNGLDPNGINSFACTDSTLFMNGGGFVHSSRDGINWTKHSLNTFATITSIGVAGDSVYLTTKTGRLYYTKDEGENWTLIENTETSRFANAAALFDDKMLMTTAEGIFSSVDGGSTWLGSNKGLNAAQVNALAVCDTVLYAGTGQQGMFRSDMKGNWNKINSGLDASNANSIHKILELNDTIYIATGGGIYSTSDQGNNWVRRLDPGINKSTIALDFNNGYFATGIAGQGIYLSSDSAKTWILTDTVGLGVNAEFRCVNIIQDTIIVSNTNGKMFVSKNLGTTWENISIPNGYYYTYDLKYVNGKLYAATSKGLFISSDLGENWANFNNNREVIYCIAVSEDKIYAAKEDGVYIASSSNTEWYQTSPYLGERTVYEILKTDNNMFVGTRASSVWAKEMVNGSFRPVIVGTTEQLTTLENTGLKIELSSLIVNDYGSDFPDDFTLTILDGENYTAINDSLIPTEDFYGNLSVKIKVNNGILDSPPYFLPVQVIPVDDGIITINESACDFYTVPSGDETYTENGIYYDTLQSSQGTDSIIEIYLTIHKSYSNYDEIVTCGAYTWPVNGVTYTQTGYYGDTVPDINGCDSANTLYVVITDTIKSTEYITTCGEYVWSANGNTYTESGTYVESLISIGGCDSIATLNLTISDNIEITEQVNTCTEYLWPITGLTYNESGTYSATFTSSSGCDSIRILNLTINEVLTSYQTVTTCKKYTWDANDSTYMQSGTYTAQFTSVNGCDSIATLYLTITDLIRTSVYREACDSYYWSATNETYTKSGIYSTILTSTHDCDSLVKLNLKVTKVNTVITRSNRTLFTNEPGASYQWLDCDNNNNAIIGETKHSFKPSRNGSYAVRIVQNQCVDTSECIVFTTYTSGIENNNNSNIILYPNPTSGELTINGIINTKEIKIQNLTGQVVYFQNLENRESLNLNIAHLPIGMYYISLTDQNSTKILKVIKK